MILMRLPVRLLGAMEEAATGLAIVMMLFSSRQ